MNPLSLVPRRALRLAAATSLLLLLGACSGDTQWHTKDISGLMPKLKFQLTEDDGRTVSADDFAGKVNLLFFGFTSCQSVCPVTMSRLRKAIADLPEDQQDSVRVLFVSVDPERDDLATLRHYTSAYGPEFVGLRGDHAALDALTKRYRVTYGKGEETAPGVYQVSHSSAVFAFDRDGRARLLMRSTDKAPAITADLQRLLQS